MFSKSAHIYDQIYGSFKDYEGECRQVRAWLQKVHPSARTILDVACGTGEHARILTSLFDYEIDGIDLDAGLIAVAKEKNPTGVYCTGDMVEFSLEKTYDVVMCLFSSIGYVKTLDRVTASLKMFGRHLQDEGVIIVEPWFQPGVLTPGKILLNTAQSDNLSVVRMAACQVDDRISTLHFEYLIGIDGNITYEAEVHELGLFTVDEMMECFRNAGLTVSYDEEGLSGRGLYISRKG